jgi:hypothetical protein
MRTLAVTGDAAAALPYSDGLPAGKTGSEPRDLDPPDIEAATLTVYRLYAVGDEINLGLAEKCLRHSRSGGTALAGGRQAQSIRIAQPPLRVELGRLEGTLASLRLDGHLRASIYDLRIVVLAWESRLQWITTWGGGS